MTYSAKNSRKSLLRSGRIIFIIVLLNLLLFSYPQNSISEEIDNAAARLVSPAEGKEVVSKKPLVEIALPNPESIDSLLVFLDNSDVTGVVDFTDQGFRYSPVDILAPGPHTITVVVYTKDGSEIEEELKFSTRHTKFMKEAYSSNELTTVYESLLKKPKNVNGVPYAKLDTILNSEVKLSEGGWDFYLTTTIRYFDQNAPVLSPEHKGLNILGYQLRSSYQTTSGYISTELGDIQVDLTPNTAAALSRRGGSVSMGNQRFSLGAFMVMSEEEFEVNGGTGLDGGLDDHIIGGYADLTLVPDRVKVKNVYLQGGESGFSYGYSSAEGGSEGEVYGIALDTVLFKSWLKAGGELDLSRYDADTSDQFSEESDKAYNAWVEGGAKGFSYKALYEYFGPEYKVVANRGVLNDREGFDLNGFASHKSHSLGLSFSNYSDNVEDNDFYATTRFYSGLANYTFTGIKNLMANLNYQKSIVDSKDEPVDYPVETKMHTDTVKGTLNYMRGMMNLALSANYSFQNDRTDTANDTTIVTYSFAPTFNLKHAQIAPSVNYNTMESGPNGVDTDTTTVTLNLQGDTFHRKIAYEFAGNYNRVVSDNSSTDMYTYNSEFRVAYRIADKFLGYVDPSVGFRGEYYKSVDKRTKTDNDELLFFLILSTKIAFMM